MSNVRRPRARVRATAGALALLRAGRAISYSSEARRELVDAIWFTRPSPLTDEEMSCALGILERWRAAGFD